MRKPVGRRQPCRAVDEHDQTFYLVADDFGNIGRAWRETDYEPRNHYSGPAYWTISQSDMRHPLQHC